MTDPAPTPAQAAQAEIASLKSGADAAFTAAFRSADAPGHGAAVERLNRLHEAAYGPEAEAQTGAAPGGEAAADGGTPGGAEGDNAPEQPTRPLPLQFSPDAAGETVTAAHKLANETVKALGLDPDVAHGAVAMLENSIAKRGQKPMDAVELAHFDAVLQQRMGEKYGTAMASVRDALKNAGKGGEWLRKAILASGPETAMWAFETLAAQLARPKD